MSINITLMDSWSSYNFYGYSYQEIVSVLPFNASISRDALLSDLASQSREGYYLWLKGCRTPSGTHDCTAACMDPKETFASLYTLSNCVAYPYISMLISSGDLSPTAMTYANQFNIIGNYTFDPTAISELQENCFMEYYNDTSNKCQGSVLDLPSWSPCDECSFPVAVNSDIGGIGVYVSYWIQSSVALAAFLLLQLLDSWIFYMCFGYFRLRSESDVAKNKALDVQKKWIRRHRVVLLSAMVEFQKAQCFFTLPVQVGALVALATPDTLAPTTLEQFYNNYFMIGLVGISGILPVVFVLFCLHGAGVKSWYVFGLSAAAISVSAVTLVKVGLQATSLDSVPNLTPAPTYGNCGETNPATCCLGQEDIQYGAGPYNLEISLTVLVLLLLDILWNPEKPAFMPARDWLLKVVKQQKFKYSAAKPPRGYRFLLATVSSPIKAQFGKDYMQLVIKSIFALCYLCMWIWFLCFFLFFLVGLSSLQDAKALDTQNWSFGQIVAIAIWASPISEWIYLEIRGPEAGPQYRIPKPYVVREEDENEALIEVRKGHRSVSKDTAQTLSKIFRSRKPLSYSEVNGDEQLLQHDTRYGRESGRITASSIPKPKASTTGLKTGRGSPYTPITSQHRLDIETMVGDDVSDIEMSAVHTQGLAALHEEDCIELPRATVGSNFI